MEYIILEQQQNTYPTTSNYKKTALDTITLEGNFDTNYSIKIGLKISKHKSSTSKIFPNKIGRHKVLNRVKQSDGLFL